LFFELSWAFRQSQYSSKIKYMHRSALRDLSKKLQPGCSLGLAAVQKEMCSDRQKLTTVPLTILASPFPSLLEGNKRSYLKLSQLLAET
jgi:hypothetical protein